MQCTKLLSDLTDLITEELLSNENVAHFYQDAIEFENSKLQAACETMIVSKFDEILENQHSFIMSMPKAFFKRLIESDNLHIPNENCLVELINDYIKKH